MIYISIYAFIYGELDKIAFKYDMDGNICAGEYDKKLFTRLLPRTSAEQGFIVNAQFGFPLFQHYSVCVKECPTLDGTLEWVANEQYPAGSRELAVWDYNCQNLMGFCVPDQENIETVAGGIFNEMSKSIGTFTKYLNDIVISWPIIVLMSVLALIITLGYLYCL